MSREDLAIQTDALQAAMSSAERFVKLVALKAPDIILENELRMLAPRTAQLLKILKSKREDKS